MKNKVILFVICLVALLAFQAKVVMPLVQDVASSDPFMEDSGDEKNRASEITPMTEAAFDQCNQYIANENPDFNFTFSTQPINAFSLGNYRYIVNADVDILPENDQLITRKYVCRIQFQDNSDTPNTNDPENWNIEGISGLNDL